jgi:hypothetical protein
VTPAARTTAGPRGQRGAVRWRVILGLGALALGLLALATPRLLERGSQRLGEEVAARLAEALGGTCRAGAVRVLSPREVELDAVGCAMDEGPLIGFAAGRVSARFPTSPLGGSLPPAEALSVTDLRVRLRDLPSFDAVVAREGTEGDDGPPEGADADRVEAPPGPEGEGGVDASVRLEQECLRFLAFSRALADGAGGDRLPALQRRLAPGGALQVAEAAIELADGQEVVREVNARVGRDGDGLAVTVAAELPDGGLVGFDGRLTAAGLSDARIRLERVAVAGLLDEAVGDDVAVEGGAATGTLAWAVDGGVGAWSLDVALLGAVLRAEGLGTDPVPLPALRAVGRLIADDAGGRLGLEDGRWRVAGSEGALSVALGPLGAEEETRLRASVDASELRLGELLASLPEALMPRAWADEIQGSLDLHARFEGPLHDRKRWELDWSADFSRLFLASGELAAQVDRLRRPFPHTFPARVEGGPPIVRIVGPEEPSFVALDDISSHLVNAVISTEDAGFFSHSGFQVSELKEAMLENLRDGEGRGGSTITQQLAKNLFLSGERTFSRKLKEAVIAWRLERDLPKERILEIYLNIAEWGPGLYGIHDAADHYFARRPSVLRPEEAAFLASLLPAPRRYHGYYHSGRGLTPNRHERVQEILRTMNRMGRLSARDYHLARGLPIELAWCRFEEGSGR